MGPVLGEFHLTPSGCPRAVICLLLAALPLALGGCSGSVPSTSSPTSKAIVSAGHESPQAPATYSEWSDSGDLTSEILHDADWLRAHGIHVVSWGPCGLQCSPADRERVVVYHLTPADVELLDQRYGGSNLDVENTDVPYTAVVEPPIPQH